MLLGTLNLVPWIGAYQLGLSPYNIDLGPFGIAVSTFFIAVAVFRFGALGSEEVLLYSIFASIDDGVLVLDRDGRISGFNATAQKIFSWLDANHIGKPVSSTSDAALFGSAKIRISKKWWSCQIPGDTTRVRLRRFTKAGYN